MKLKKMPKIKVRNHVALSPLLQKGGVFATETAHAQHRKARRQNKKELQPHKWL